MTVSITILVLINYYTKLHYYTVMSAIQLGDILPSAIMLSVLMLSIINLSVITLRIIMLSVIILSAIMLIPFFCIKLLWLFLMECNNSWYSFAECHYSV
jgi:hypothetical protein